jgi:hypothetical protein
VLLDNAAPRAQSALAQEANHMAVNLSVNAHSTRVASAAELRQTLLPSACEQFREICVSLDQGGPSLLALLNGDLGWLMYLRHDDGDPGFSSRNPAFETSDVAPSDRVFVSRFRGALVPVIRYRLSNGQVDEYPASWALPARDVMRALDISLPVRESVRRSCTGTTMLVGTRDHRVEGLAPLSTLKERAWGMCGVTMPIVHGARFGGLRRHAMRKPKVRAREAPNPPLRFLQSRLRSEMPVQAGFDRVEVGPGKSG